MKFTNFAVVLAVVALGHSAGAVPPGGGGKNTACTSNVKIVVLGSSTAAGAGANPVSMSWVNRYAALLASTSAQNTVINRAVGGYTTYQCLPTGSIPPAGRPKPDAGRNITYALAQHPTAIIVNLPTNDAAFGFSLDETQHNFQIIAATARAARVPMWVTTSQPRLLTPDKRAKLVAIRDWIKSAFGSKAIDFWTDIANPDGTLGKDYDCGDGTHPNNLGHAVLFRRVAAMNIPDVACALAMRSQAQPHKRVYLASRITGSARRMSSAPLLR